uniref:Interferon alpha/beta receptor 2 n=1 Tax=Sphenodon punctatus TaxID=8508 RepID=A0A8D0G7Y1_SPHPU
MEFLIGPLCLYLLVYISILPPTLYSLAETSVIKQPFNVSMKSQNFQHILSWETGSNSTNSFYYRVRYIKQSSSKEWAIAKSCSNITRLFCNLTEEYEDINSRYVSYVERFTEAGVLKTSFVTLWPFYETSLGPPVVNLSACSSCINVTVKLPYSYCKKEGKVQSLIDVYTELYYEITVKATNPQEKPFQNKMTTTQESSHTVIEGLNPNANYCISVTVAANLNHNSIPSARKCITTRSDSQPSSQPGHVIGPVFGGALVSLTVVALLLGLYVTGFIHFKGKPWPKVLEIARKLHCTVYELFPEEVCSVEVTPKEIKKASREDSYDGDSDSDNGSDCMYTRHGALGNISKYHTKPEAVVEQSVDSMLTESSSQTNPLLDAESEAHQSDAEENESTEEAFYPSFETSGSSAENHACLNVNLNSVMLGISEKTWDDSSTLISCQEDSPEVQDPCATQIPERAFTETIDLQKSDFCKTSHECEPDVSDESDASDSDVDQMGDYIRR